MTLRQNLFSFGVGTIGFQLMHVNISIFLQEFIFVNGKVLCWTMDYGFCKFTPWIVATTDFLSTVSLTWFFLDCRHTVPENKTHFIQSSLLSRQNIIMYIFMLNIPRLILILTNLIGTFMLKKKGSKILKKYIKNVGNGTWRHFQISKFIRKFHRLLHFPLAKFFSHKMLFIF